MPADPPPPGRARSEFWVDRGGTFTDVVARRPDGSLVAHKLLSVSPAYRDAAVAGVRELLGLAAGEPVPADRIGAVEARHHGGHERAARAQGRGGRALVITAGSGDALRIGYQNRPRIFDRHIVLPGQLYERVIEVPERAPPAASWSCRSTRPPRNAGCAPRTRTGSAPRRWSACTATGTRSTSRGSARSPPEFGFTQVSESHATSPLMRLVSRGDTTVVDAYLSPVLRRYVDEVAAELSGVRLLFMQSNGGLTDAASFRGKDSILSGPAGGIVDA